MHTKKCILARGTKPLRNGQRSPKDYPYWDDLIKEYQNKVQLTVIDTVLPLEELKQCLLEADVIVTVDSFIQHYCWSLGKKCIVLFGKSDPLIYGHKENINVLKDRKYLNANQFDIWESHVYDPNVFVTPDVVIDIIDALLT